MSWTLVLQWRQGDQVSDTLVYAERSIIVGRDPSCDLVIPRDAAIAPQHVRIDVRPWDLAITIRPIGDANVRIARIGGTRINGVLGRRITEPCRLDGSHELAIGDTTLRARTEGVPAPRRWWDPRDWSADAALDPSTLTEQPPVDLRDLAINPPPPVPVPTTDRAPADPSPLPFGALFPHAPLPVMSNPPAPRIMVDPPAWRPTIPPAPHYRGTVTHPPMRRTATPTDPIERGLLEALQREPHDWAARLVYSDWLEQQGDDEDAAFVRGEREIPSRAYIESTAAAWRAITSCRAINCGRLACDERWSTLHATGDARLRRCHICERDVHYCEDRDEVDFHLGRGELVTIDPDLLR